MNGIHRALSLLTDSHLFDVANKLLDDNKQKFLTWPASLRYHHKQAGGLYLHTSEVCHIALDSSDRITYDDDLQVLAFSALFHDLGKLYEYKVKYIPFDPRYGPDTGEPIEYEDVPTFKKRIGHVVKSFEIVTTALTDHELLPEIQHCILSHHGRLEWGSPVVPETQNAKILHFSDMISSQT